MSATSFEMNGYTFRGSNSSVLISAYLLNGKWGSTRKEKEFAPVGANSFTLRVDPILDGVCCRGKRQEVTKMSPSGKMVYF